VPAKVAWYFSIIPHLRRLFTNKANAELLQWHTR
jgi:mannose/fructose/N-acetylgalactosamine-specific phosphotransferase system component IID